MVAPLVGERGVLGAMTIVDRMGEGTTFDADDVRLLETIANQAAVALENGQLEQSLNELSRLKEQLRHQAYHDSLTGLANRALFVEEVERRLEAPWTTATCRSSCSSTSTTSRSSTTRSVTPPATSSWSRSPSASAAESGTSDLAARLGGDEFAVLPAPAPTSRTPWAWAGGSSTRSSAVPVGGTEVVGRRSIGVAAARGGDRWATSCCATPTSRCTGPRPTASSARGVRPHGPPRRSSSATRSAPSSPGASCTGRAGVHYQPIVELATGRPVGVEALARWRHPTRGLVDPEDFIRLAEESGTIRRPRAAVLRRAGARWSSGSALPGLEDADAQRQPVAAGAGACRVHRELDEDIAAIGLRPDALTLEITETALSRDPQATSATLDDLRDRGVRIAMDDFGTGYSSLAYLRRFPVDTLKIARELIGPRTDVGPDRGLGVRPRDRGAGPDARAEDRRRGHRDAGPARDAPRTWAATRDRATCSCAPAPAEASATWLVEAAAAPDGARTIGARRELKACSSPATSVERPVPPGPAASLTAPRPSRRSG